MSECGRDCCCRFDFSRRDFLKISAGTVGLASAARAEGLKPGTIPPEARERPPKEWFDALHTATSPIVYSGKSLENLIFPIGGIGTGTIWLHGSGRLVNWQIFNNIRKNSHVDDTFFAVRIDQPGSEPIVRVLRQGAFGPFAGFEKVEFTGRYPVATVRFSDASLPIDVELEAFNPLVPLDEEASGIPCGIFTVRAINKTSKRIGLSLLGSLQNAVGHAGEGSAEGNRHTSYGNNVNRFVEAPNMRAVTMRALPGKPAQMYPPVELMADPNAVPLFEEIPVRGLSLISPGSSETVATIETVYWLDNGDLKRLGASVLREIAEGVRMRGANLLVSGKNNPLLKHVKPTAPAGEVRRETIYATFDRANMMSRWSTRRSAFGGMPKSGTADGQSPVSGYLGPGLVNSFNPNDGPQGNLTSKEFIIKEKYISFLIGGGNHPDKCCVNLKVDGKVVRTATGKNTEHLERVEWDVSEFAHAESQIEILDHVWEAWGHILVDDIRFGNLPIDAITAEEAKAWNAVVDDLSAAKEAEAVGVGRGRVMKVFRDLGKIKPGEDRLARRDEILRLIADLAEAEYEPAVGRPPASPSFGTMCLATPSAEATVEVGWTDRDVLYKQFAEVGALTLAPRPDERLTEEQLQAGPTGAGQTVNTALCVQTRAGGGGRAEATFVFGWHFPHQYYPQNNWRMSGNKAIEVGHMYVNWFHDATAVAREVVLDLERLRRLTFAYRDAMFDTTLPQYLVDAAAANASIIRSPTCFRIKDGTFYGFEGCGWNGGGCCPMNCNHVWNYEQTLAKLWPALDRNMRVTELRYHQRDDGGTYHRVEVPRDRPDKHSIPVADGQCGAVLKAYREHLQSRDRRFLDDHWSRIRKAMDFAISEWDKDGDGVMEQPQFNTYDRPIFGMNSFVSSLYLAALRAAQEMARLSRDEASAERYRGLFEKGRDKIAAELFDGEYYIQKADNINLGYGQGCWSDQVVGQWWARVLNLGDILPNDQVQSALRSIFKYSWLWTQEGFVGTQRFRQFADGKDKGLLCGSWPKGGRPHDPILYRDEAWTGVEYQVAGHKLYEGQVEDALAIVKGVRERYAGAKKSPWNEIECGDYYVRALSSWSLLLAAQGYAYDGPARMVQLNPRLMPENHRSFISFAEGWGVFEQQRKDKMQIERITILHGRLDVKVLRFGLPAGAEAATGTVTAEDREWFADVRYHDGFAVIELGAPATVLEKETLTVELEWA